MPSIPANTFTVDDDTHVIVADKTNEDVYLQLPDPGAATTTRTPRYVKVIGNNTRLARLIPIAGTIEGAAYWETSTHRKGLILLADGINDWMIMAQF